VTTRVLVVITLAEDRACSGGINPTGLLGIEASTNLDPLSQGLLAIGHTVSTVGRHDTMR
jgi:hypothetical protein